MITLLVDECYAFDYLSILEIKAELSGTATAQHAVRQCVDHITNQLGALTATILASPEYAALRTANQRTFDCVELAKQDLVSAARVDACNYQRYLDKQALQRRFFATELVEVKAGLPSSAPGPPGTTH